MTWPTTGSVPRRSRRALLAGTAAALGSAVVSACRSSTDTISANGPVELAIVGILTRDINTSLAFYRRLGLDLPDSVDGASHRHRSANGSVLFWEEPVVVRGFDPEWDLPVPGDRRIVLEFGFATTEHLEATYDDLVASGAESYLVPFDQGGGIRYAMVLDPDGNQISLRHPATR